MCLPHTSLRWKGGEPGPKPEARGHSLGQYVGGDTVSTRKLAEFIVQTGYEQLPKEAVEASKNAILDCIGVALAGSGEEMGKITSSLVGESVGQPVSGVIGGGFRTSPILASLANGTIAHALDYDDIIMGYGHPSVVHVPTILALGEKCKSSGKEALAAYIIGVEVGAKLGGVLGEQHYDKGWHATSTIGSLGAAASAAKLLKLDVKQTRMALGIAASLASGLRENFGTMTKPLHAGNAARNAVIAGLLAEKGYTADESILEGQVGFLKVFGEDLEYDLEGMCQQLGSPFAVISPGIWLKAYPSCGGTHATIDGALQLRRKYSFQTDEVVEVECTTSKLTPKVLLHHRPKTGLEGRFSLEYCVSAALIDGELTFTDERVLAPEIQNFIPKVKYSHPVEIADKGFNDLPRTVTIRLRNGEVLSSKVSIPRGMPGNPLSKEELQSKFNLCAQVVLPAQERAEVIRVVTNLEHLADISSLMDLLMG